ncbi:MAG: hypothetical protein ABJA57_00870 [Ginsengibacter sp.]
MNPSRLLLKTLNVHHEEWWLVEKLFVMQFFQGAGIAFFFTGAFSYFLNRFSITQLPYVLIASSFLLWATGYVYHLLEHRLSLSKLAIVITLLMTASILFFRVGTEFITAEWFFYLLLAWYNVLYLLNNLVFWGLASQFYDVRQSKRLFGVIGAGDIPAKFIGYTAALLVIKYLHINQPLLETRYLLFTAFICMLCSLPILRIISGNKTLNIGSKPHHAAHHPHSKHQHDSDHHEQSHQGESHKSRYQQYLKRYHDLKHQTSNLKNTLKNFTVNALIRRIAVISFIGYACYLLTNYVFYSEVKHVLHEDESLASFIAFFYAIARLLALFIKLVFTSRLIRQMGYRSALMILPVSLILFMLMLFMAPVMVNSEKVIFYVFGAAAIALEVLRTSIDTPVLLTIMQPLSSIEKLRAHNIVKGIMDPFAFLFSGTLLLLLVRLKWYSLDILGIILIVLGTACIFFIYQMNRAYLKTLIKTISSRYLSHDEFDLHGKEMLEMVEKKIDTGTELEVLYILKMLDSQKEGQINQLVIKALQHPSSRVVNEALDMINTHNITDASDPVYQMIQDHPDIHIRSGAIRVLQKINYSDEVAGKFINHPDKHLQMATIISVLNFEHTSVYKEEAETITKALYSSADPVDRINATSIIRNIRPTEFDDQLIGLLNDPNKRVVESAIYSIGEKPGEELIVPLLLKMREYDKAVSQALLDAGSICLPHMKETILDEHTSDKQREKLIFLCGRIGGEKGIQALLNLLLHLPQKSTAIIKALHRCHFSATQKDLHSFEAATRQYLVYAAEMLHMQKGLYRGHEKFHVLNNSLQIELGEIREVLLCLFSFLYDREKIERVKSAMELKKRDAQANAMELLDMTVKKDFAHYFSTIYEHGDLVHRCAALKNIVPKDEFKSFEHVINGILSEEKFSYNTWTKACSMYSGKKNELRINQDMVQKYLESDNILLQETARFAS